MRTIEQVRDYFSYGEWFITIRDEHIEIAKELGDYIRDLDTYLSNYEKIIDFAKLQIEE